MSFKDSISSNDEDSLIETQPLKNHNEELTNDDDKENKNINRPSSFNTGRRKISMKSRIKLGHAEGTESLSRKGDLGCTTPDFAMTQSLYDPSDKRIKQQRDGQESKLMKLMAKEKLAKIAVDKKHDELLRKAREQRQKNEQRRQLFEERRQKIAQQRTSSRSNILEDMTSSRISKAPNGIRTGSSSKSSFLASRPLSSTGKIFGFGSSTPRYACDPLPNCKMGDRARNYSISQLDQPSQRMFASQIMTRSNYEVKKVSQRSKLASTTNLLESSTKSTNIKTVNPTTIKPKELKTKDHHLTDSIRSRSVQKNRNQKSSTLERPSKSLSNQRATTNSVMSKSVINNQATKSVEVKSKPTHKPDNSTNKNAADNKHDVLESQSNLEEVSKGSTKDVSAEEYRKKLNEQRRLAKERKAREAEELSKKQQMDSSNNNSEDVTKLEVDHISHDTLINKDTIDEQINDKCKVEFEIAEKEKPTLEPIKPIIKVEENIPNDISKEEKKENKIEQVDNDKDNLIPSVPTKPITDMISSHEDLAREERKKKLDSIMSRIRRPSGSTENLTRSIEHLPSSPPSGSVLQHMMDRGHLTGMSKTAAVLMKAHQHMNHDHEPNDNVNSIQTQREDCDGKEDSPVMKEAPLDPSTKKVVENANQPNYSMGIWQDKYGLSSSVDSESEVS